ncbi:MarR family winged helix-turn-helix transcriptional regulator [Microbacterium limosum]|uniref:MarR family winged helix-turn-helix transcriptional regulator n=1 Tax=Microbacterium limosum TaxID=3079935 RepID=A0AAU0MHV0_9MICO|nr:MarR family winged helix-turn-helix transcriptional regulator [Microbacterium sp. Y20]WOQ69559.1 MarR family winged helix-turn-helix transcriptional regulator [Microbacterium sp. Y20]
MSDTSRDPAESIAAALSRVRRRRGGRGRPVGDGGHRSPEERLAGAARLRVLEALDAASAPLTIGAVADAIGVDQPRASRLVQQAIDLGHAVRQADPADARRTLIGLGDGGRELVARVRAERRAAVEAALGGFTPEESAQLATLLTRFANAWPRS